MKVRSLSPCSTVTRNNNVATVKFLAPNRIFQLFSGIALLAIRSSTQPQICCNSTPYTERFNKTSNCWRAERSPQNNFQLNFWKMFSLRVNRERIATSSEGRWLKTRRKKSFLRNISVELSPHYSEPYFFIRITVLCVKILSSAMREVFNFKMKRVKRVKVFINLQKVAAASGIN